METWAVVTIVVVSNIITAVSMYFITRLQVSHSDKRFDKELERAREVDSRERRREVRGQPLLKLRSELACVAAKYERLVSAAQTQHTRPMPVISDEVARKVLEEARDDMNEYLRSGELTKTLLMIEDKDLIDRVAEINKDYDESYYVNISFQEFPSLDIGKAMQVFERNKARIVETQGIINKRLEEL